MDQFHRHKNRCEKRQKSYGQQTARSTARTRTRRKRTGISLFSSPISQIIIATTIITTITITTTQLAIAQDNNDIDYTCDIQADYSSNPGTPNDCPTLGDGTCDDPKLGGSGGDGCRARDCMDCNVKCQEFTADCNGCLNAKGCYYCPQDATCENSGDYTSNGNRQCLPRQGDYYSNVYGDTAEDKCTNIPDAFYQDPLWEGQKWVYDAINIQQVWSEYKLEGEGIVIRINDDGVDVSNVEFQDRFDDVDNSCSVYTPNPDDIDGHGTAVAGILLANSNNGYCAAGIASKAKFSACNFFAPDVPYSSLAYKLDTFHISQNSIGMPACGDDGLVGAVNRFQYEEEACPFEFVDETSQRFVSPCETCQDDNGNFPSSTAISTECAEAISGHCKKYYREDRAACRDFPEIVIGGECNYNKLPKSSIQALETGITQGRSGKGTVFVFASGNDYARGDDVNYSGWTNSRFTITVGAIGKNGKHAGYSTPGAAIFLTAPGGGIKDLGHLMTAGLGATKCADSGQGTSFSTPVVSGVIALMLEMRPELTWRDVQGVLASTSQRVLDDENDESATVNGGGFWHSRWYGFGVVDALAAVEAARDWELWTDEEQVVGMSSLENAPINDDPNNLYTSTIVITENEDSPADFITESTVVLLDIYDTNRGDLEIVLTSPDGTESLLHPGKIPESTILEGDERWKLMTLRNWGENPIGTWSLTVRDLIERDNNDEAAAPASGRNNNDENNNIFGRQDEETTGNIFRQWTLVAYGRSATLAAQEDEEEEANNNQSDQAAATGDDTSTTTNVEGDTTNDNNNVVVDNSFCIDQKNGVPIYLDDCDLIPETGEQACPAGFVLTLGDQVMTLDAKTVCPVDATIEMTQNDAAQQGLCGCDMTMFDNDCNLVTYDNGQDLICECYPCPEGSSFVTAFACNQIIISTCNQIDCNGGCNIGYQPPFYDGIYTLSPTIAPSSAPTLSLAPTISPTLAPTLAPTVAPTLAPTLQPTNPPTNAPVLPTFPPTTTWSPTQYPTDNQTSIHPSDNPTSLPTFTPTALPSAEPVTTPSAAPTTSIQQTSTIVPTTMDVIIINADSPTVSPSTGQNNNNNDADDSIPNASCDRATTLAGDGVTTFGGSITLSSSALGGRTIVTDPEEEWSCLSGHERNGGWYNYVGTGQIVTLTACALDPSKNIGIHVFTSAGEGNDDDDSSSSCGGALTCIENQQQQRPDCGDEEGNNNNDDGVAVSFVGEMGKTYHVLVSGLPFGVEGRSVVATGDANTQRRRRRLQQSNFDYEVNVKEDVVPNNTECSVSSTITPFAESVTANTVSDKSVATLFKTCNDDDDNDDTEERTGVWYTVSEGVVNGTNSTGGGEIVYQANSCKDGTNFNNEISVFRGADCDSLQCVANVEKVPCQTGQFGQVAYWTTSEEEKFHVFVHGGKNNDGATMKFYDAGNFVMDISYADRSENDQCIDALQIDLDEEISGTTSGEMPDMKSVDASSCALGGAGAWYKIPGNGKPFQASTCGTATDHPTTLYVYSGECADLSCVDQAEGGGGKGALCDLPNDDGSAGGDSATVNFDAQAGVDYYILVTGRGGAVGNFGMTVTEIEPAANNLCENGELLTPDAGEIEGSTLRATADDFPQGKICGVALDSSGVWYTVDGTGEGIEVSVCADNFHAAVSVFRGTSCTDLDCVTGTAAASFSPNPQCDHDESVAASWLSDPNTKYYVYVHGDPSKSSNVGDFQISSKGFKVNTSNEFCPQANSVPVNGERVQGSTMEATHAAVSTSTCGVEITSPGLWYTFEGTGIPYTLSACSDDGGNNFDTSVSVFTGSCDDLTCVSGTTFADNSCSTTVQRRSLRPQQHSGSDFRFMTSVGTDYYVFVHGQNGEGSFNLYISEDTVDVFATDSPTPAPVPVRFGQDLYREIPVDGNITIVTNYSSLEIISKPSAGGTATTENQAISYTPPKDYVGEDVMVVDGCYGEQNDCYQFIVTVRTMMDDAEVNGTEGNRTVDSLNNDDDEKKKGWNKLWLLMLLLLIPIFAVPILLYFFWYRKRKKANAEKKEKNNGDDDESSWFESGFYGHDDENPRPRKPRILSRELRRNDNDDESDSDSDSSDDDDSSSTGSSSSDDDDYGSNEDDDYFSSGDESSEPDDEYEDDSIGGGGGSNGSGGGSGGSSGGGGGSGSDNDNDNGSINSKNVSGFIRPSLKPKLKIPKSLRLKKKKSD